MPNLSSLIEYAQPVEPTTLCGRVLDRFLDFAGCDLLAVVKHGRPLGVVARGAIRAQHAGLKVSDMMTPVLTVGPETEADDACQLILAHNEPVPGLVIVEGGHYRGVVSARALFRFTASGADAAEANRRFVELLNHEVRTPMNGVVAVADLLQRQPLPADAQAFVRTIMDSSLATLRALNDALELSRAEVGELALELQPAPLRELMDDIQGRWQARANEEGVKLLVAYDGPPDLSAMIDLVRVRQVFDNLIDAALTLGRQGAVEAGLLAVREPEGLRLTGRVCDTGGGLTTERMAPVLNGEGIGLGDGGLHAGLGLSLCRRLVQRMNGQMRAEANPGAGATVVFEIMAPEAVSETQADRSNLVKRPAHVLVVDDNATNRMVAEALCEMFECSCESVVDGIEALEAARSGRFDLILMDIRMPRMDGLEASRAIRALPGPAGAVPIIALTANADPEDAKAYIAGGMQCVVEKPIKPEQLLAAINAALPDNLGRAVAA
ncbi:MAG TPA: response regulator [Caulobacteraceae bacterium]|nr:response regulator [Caulobacteraceae bacterium]